MSEQWQAQASATWLQEKHGSYTALNAHAEYTGIRVTPSVYTTMQEIDYFARAVATE